MNNQLEDKKYIAANAVIYQICTKATKALPRLKNINDAVVSNTTIKIMSRNLGVSVEPIKHKSTHLSQTLAPFNRNK